MATIISKNLKKQTVIIDKNGAVVSDTANNKDGKSNIQIMQEQRARRLGLTK